MSETIDMKEIEKEIRRKRFKEKVKEVKETVKVGLADIWERHGDEIKTYSPALIAGAAFLGKEAMRHRRITSEDHRRECRHYDRRSDEYVYSKRPLKASEKRMLEKMYLNGMSKTEALYAMGLLK